MPAMLIIGMGGKPKKGNTNMNPMESFLSGGKGGDSDHLVEDEDSSMKSGKISFSKPAGFKVPDGVKDGEAFDAMATVKLVDGKLVLSELDGTPVDDEPESEEGSDEEESQETPEEESAEDESAEPAEKAPEEGGGEENEGEEPADFLDAIEKKSSKSDKEKEDKKRKGNPFAK